MKSQHNNLSVGQVVYLCSRRETKVYPVLIAEQIVKTTLDGDSVSYVVKLPTSDHKEVPLDSIDAEVFSSIEEARSEMLSRATDQIEKILTSAKSLSTSAFRDFEIRVDDPVSSEKPEEEDDEEFAVVDLGGGQTARINLDTLDKMGDANVSE